MSAGTEVVAETGPQIGPSGPSDSVEADQSALEKVQVFFLG